MHKLAPEIKRQRLLIEGFYQTEVNEDTIKSFFGHITEVLNLRMYAEPIIFSPNSLGKDENQGYDAFVPLIDSGISLYVWTKAKFLSSVIYTCKYFDTNLAIEATKNFFKVDTLNCQEF